MNRKEIIEQLRRRGLQKGISLGTHLGICDIAADLIEHQQEEIKQLKSRLQKSIELTKDEVSEFRHYLNFVKNYYPLDVEIRMAIFNLLHKFPNDTCAHKSKTKTIKNNEYITEIEAACNIINNLLFCLEHCRRRKFKSTIKQTIKEAEYALKSAEKQGWYKNEK